MKKFLWVFGGFFLLCIFTILLTPSFINWNDYKTEITKNIKELTGQTLIIDGDIDISIIPSPAIVASEIRLLNQKAKNSEPLAYVKSVEIEIIKGIFFS